MADVGLGAGGALSDIAVAGAEGLGAADLAAAGAGGLTAADLASGALAGAGTTGISDLLTAGGEGIGAADTAAALGTDLGASGGLAPAVDAIASAGGSIPSAAAPAVSTIPASAGLTTPTAELGLGEDTIGTLSGGTTPTAADLTSASTLTSPGGFTGPQAVSGSTITSATPDLSGTSPLDIGNWPSGPVGAPSPAASSALAEAPAAISTAPASTPITTGPAVTPSAAPAASGIGDTLKGVLNSPYTKAAELALPLGYLGYTAIKGPPALPGQATTATNLGNTLAAEGQQNLTTAAAGKITASQQAQIDTYVRNQTNQLYQRYAQMGRDPSQDTDYLQGLEMIQQQGVAMQQQFIDQLISTGLNETSQASNSLLAAAQLQMQSDQIFAQQLTGALQAFGFIAAFQGKSA